MKKFIPYVLVLLFSFSSCSTLQNYIPVPTALETVSALRQVLDSSTLRAISKLSKLSTGGVEALLPEQIKPVLGLLNKFGMGESMEDISKLIQNASLLAVGESQAVITDAIGQIDFKDAVSVVTGGDNAATLVMKNAMYGSVKKRYSEKIDVQLNKSDLNQFWPLAANAYNLFAEKKVDGNLSDFLAERAVDVVFVAIGKEETNIRKDPSKLGKAVVTKVFDYYDKKQESSL